MSMFANTSNLTAKRAAFKDEAFDLIFREIARQLVGQQTTREIAIEATGGLLSVATPSTGKGHADTCKEYVAKQVDAYIAELNANTPKKG